MFKSGDSEKDGQTRTCPPLMRREGRKAIEERAVEKERKSYWDGCRDRLQRMRRSQEMRTDRQCWGEAKQNNTGKPD